MKADRLPSEANRNYFLTCPEKWTGANESGIEPVGTKVLVLTDSIGDTTVTGMIHIPPDVQERMTMAITTGVLIAIGGGGFTNWPTDSRPWPGVIPAVGDRIHLARYAGVVVDGKDGKRYRLVQDTDITGRETGDHKPQQFAVGGNA